MILHALSWAPSKLAAAPGADDPVIVLLHGLGDTADIWRPLMRHWRPPVRVVALDLPGHGRSSCLRADSYTVSDLASHVAQALYERDIVMPILIGHSLGARICIDLAKRLDTRTRDIVLIDMGIGGNDTIAAAISAHIDALSLGCATMDNLIDLVLTRLPFARREAVEVVVSAMATRSAGRWHVPLDPAIKLLLASPPGGDVLLRALAGILRPVSLIRGAFSAVLTQPVANRLAAAIQCQPVRTHVIQQAGHAIPIEQPEALAQAIEECLVAAIA